MALLITSTRVEAGVQNDGRISVREVHIADGGEREETIYLALADADLDALLAVHADQFLTRLAGG